MEIFYRSSRRCDLRTSRSLYIGAKNTRYSRLLIRRAKSTNRNDRLYTTIKTKTSRKRLRFIRFARFAVTGNGIFSHVRNSSIFNQFYTITKLS